MKVLFVALCLVAACSASLLTYPAAYPFPYHYPYAYGPYSPYSRLAYAHAPLTYVAKPQLIVAAPAPVIQPGYVAATRGSLHIAPLPGDTPLASHHLNLAPAPGTE